MLVNAVFVFGCTRATLEGEGGEGRKEGRGREEGGGERGEEGRKGGGGWEGHLREV